MRLLISVFVVLCMLASPAMAQKGGDSVFVVSKVPVQATADNATSAQRIAIDVGRKQAMDILLRRLTPEQDWVFLPRLAIDEQAVAAEDPNELIEQPDVSIEAGYYGFAEKSALYLSGAQLPTLEQGFAVFNEKSSRNTYAAQVTYRFKADEIRLLLKRARLPYSESQTRTALILPVLETTNGKYLWESNNPWARAWLARPLMNELTPFQLPLGDREDVELISVDQVLAFDQIRLQQLAEKYGVTQILLAHGFLSEVEGQYRFRVVLKDAYLNTVARATSAVDASTSAYLYDDTSGFGTDGSGGATSSSSLGQSLLETFYREPVGDYPLLASRAVESTVAKYAASWKAQTLIDHSASRAYQVNAWFASIDEWARIRQVLDGTPFVDSYDSTATTADSARVIMRIAGEIDQLTIALRQDNIVFWSVDGVVWNIATTATYENVKDLVRPVSLEQRVRLEGEDFQSYNRPEDTLPPSWQTDLPSGEGLYDPNGSGLDTLDDIVGETEDNDELLNDGLY